MSGIKANSGSITATVEIRGPDGKLKHELFLTTDLAVDLDIDQADIDEDGEEEAPLNDNCTP